MHPSPKHNFTFVDTENLTDTTDIEEDNDLTGLLNTTINKINANLPNTVGKDNIIASSINATYKHEKYRKSISKNKNTASRIKRM